MATVVLRWYASAAEAAGTSEETVDGDTLVGVLTAARERHGERLARLLDVCSVLVDGQRADRDAALPLAPGSAVDVLPPFAGG